jgi:hypothetical protein
LKSKTNAAWASHPSRIVIADVLPAVFRRGERIAQLHSEKCGASTLTAKLSLHGYSSALSSSLEGGFLRRPRSPGADALDMRRISPGDSLSKITGDAEPLSNSFRTSHAFDWKHFAGVKRLTQLQSAARLCKNCEGEKLPVERGGKVQFYSPGSRRMSGR